jgi:Immunity protein 74
MFTSTGSLIQSDSGFSVHWTGRAGIEYREGEKLMLVDSELLAGENGEVIWKDSIRAWMPPFDKEQLSQEKREEILANICAAYAFAKVKVEVS